MFHDLSRLSEVIARDSRRMKHVFVVKRGSLAIWKRLDPEGPTAKPRKNDYDPIDNDKSALFLSCACSDLDKRLLV